MLDLILAAAIASQPAPAVRTTDIQVGAVKLRVPLPEGYCLPEGDYVAAAQILAAADTDNLTLLTLHDCDPGRTLDNYLLVKTPIGALNAKVDRAELIELLTSPEVAQEMAQGMASGEYNRKTNERYNELGAEGSPIKADIMLRGNDDVCVYLGGLGSETVEGKTITKAVAGCMTAAGGRMISLYGYREGKDPEAYRRLMPELRHWATQIEAAP